MDRGSGYKTEECEAEQARSVVVSGECCENQDRAGDVNGAAVYTFEPEGSGGIMGLQECLGLSNLQ